MSNGQSETKQEKFQIKNSNENGNKKVIRQDRMNLEVGKAWVEIYQHKYEIYNISCFGCAFIIPKDLAIELRNYIDLKNKTRLPARILYESIVIQDVNLLFVRELIDKNYNGEESVWVFESMDGPFNLSKLESLEKSQAIVNSQKDFQQKRTTIPDNLRFMVFEMQDWFENLKKMITQIEQDEFGIMSLQTFEDKTNMIEHISIYLGNIIPEMYSKIPDLIKDMNANDQENFKIFAREILGSYVYGAPFAARAYHKPRGYAGDYEMMNHLYTNETMGNTLFDQCMHRYLVEEPAGRAVKNRAVYLADKINNIIVNSKNNRPVKIASIASGPGVEVQFLLDNLKDIQGRDVEFYFIDQDIESLKYAQKKIISKDRFVKSGFKFNFINNAVKNIIADGLDDQGFDLIYSAGLFDYFSSPVARIAAEKIYEALSENGVLVIGNFNVGISTTPLMETLLDWNLIYRSKKDMEILFGGIGKAVEIENEPLNINLFANIIK
jgi:hypothetical protein